MKAAPKSQRAMYDEASRKSAEINETWLEMLPTMRRRDLERLIEKRPALWGRFAAYLTSGHRFVDDPPAHATKKKSATQLEREINEALNRKVERGEVTPYEGMRVLVTKYGAMHHGLRPGVRGVIKRVTSPTQWPTAALRVVKS
jgi:hypothetical protein